MFTIPNIEYKGGLMREIRTTQNKYNKITFYKEYEYFESEDVYTKFIKSCESAIRKDPEYSHFEALITNKLGLNFCQVNPEITSDYATINMHHGPLFTLYDYCAVILNKRLRHNELISTMRITDDILQLHFDGMVQVVMMTVTNHEAVHNRDIFLNIKQGFGDVSKFIKRYSEYFSDDYKYRIWRYISLCKEVDSFDYGLLDFDEIEPLITI